MKLTRYFTGKNSLAVATAVLLTFFTVACARQAGVDSAEKTGEEAAAADPNAPAPEGAASQLAENATPAAASARNRPAASGGTRPAQSNAATPSAGQQGGSGWGDQPAGASSAAPSAPPAPVFRTFTLPEGSTIRVRTTSTLSTKTATSGASFAGSLVEPLTVDGRTIAEKGANVTGKIVNSDPGGRVKGKASLTVTVTGVELIDGTMANVDTTSYGQVADSSTKKDAAKVAIGSGIGAAIGAIAGGGKGAAIGAGVGAGAGTGAVLATRGSDAVIPAEALINFTTQSPISIKLKD